MHTDISLEKTVAVSCGWALFFVYYRINEMATMALLLLTTRKEKGNFLYLRNSSVRSAVFLQRRQCAK